MHIAVNVIAALAGAASAAPTVNVTVSGQQNTTVGVMNGGNVNSPAPAQKAGGQP